MGFWTAAREAAGEQYGKENWRAYARREKWKRASGGILVGAGVLFVVARTYADVILTGIMYGALYTAAFIAVLLCTYIGVRTYKRRVHRRTYTPSMYVRTEELPRVHTERVRTFMNESL
jgi:hypothetical protein